MERPKAMLEIDDRNECYEMLSVEPLCDHDGDKARQHIATIYDHAEALRPAPACTQKPLVGQEVNDGR